MRNARIFNLKRFDKFFVQCGFGFTLLELLTVLAILATIASIAFPVYSNQIEKAKTTKAILEIQTLEKEISQYRFETNALPKTLDAIGYGNWLDPWGTPYQYYRHEDIPKGKRRKYKSTVPLNTDYDLYSMGPNRETKVPITTKAGYDDIVRANDGGYIGPASQF